MILEVLYKGLLNILFYSLFILFAILRCIVSLFFLTSVIGIVIYYPIAWVIGLFLKGES
jgi:membrane glycosyltransferase